MLLLCVLFGRTAGAHDPFETTSVVSIRGDRIVVHMIAARATAEVLFGAQAGRAVGVTWPDQAALQRLYELSSDGRPLELRKVAASEGVDGEAAGDLVLEFEFTRPPGRALRLRALYLEQLEQGYTGVVQVEAAASQTDAPELLDLKVLHSSDPVLEFRLPAAGTPEEQATGASTTLRREPEARSRPFWMFLCIGLEHVALGYDHLLFLVSVLLACRRLGQVLGVLTTFTVAHSVTLSLAALHLVPLVNGFVEPVIALSIAVAALYGERLEERRLLLPVTFAFGLIHGLGFAAGLESLSDAGGVRLVGLIGFNLGVELGQVAAALALIPLIRWCRGSEKGQLSLTWTGRLIGALGGALFLLRVLALE